MWNKLTQSIQLSNKNNSLDILFINQQQITVFVKI